MATCKDCKDCFHYELCGVFDYIPPDECGFYTDRSRFVELPCKVGDTVYVLSKQIVCDTVDGIAIEKFPDSSILYQVYCEKSRATYEFKDFGKIIFLDPESAEQALKERKETSGDSPGGEG